MKRLLLIFVFFQSSYSFAQLSIGPKLGMGWSSFKYTRLTTGTTTSAIFDGTVVYKPILTPQIGIAFNMYFWKVLSFRPELFYNQRGYSASYTLQGYPMQETYRLSYLELPINLVAHGELGTGQLEVFTGLNFAYCLGGQKKTELGGESRDLKIKSGKYPDNPSENTEYVNPFHASLNIGVGYKFKKLSMQLGYNIGLSSLNPHYENSSYEGLRNYYVEIKASSFNLGITYFFDLKK